MISLKFYLDKRHLKGALDKVASIKVVVTRNRSTALINTNISVLPTQWDAKQLKVIDHPNERRLNLHLSKFMITIQNIVLDMEENGLAAGMNAIKVKDYIMDCLYPKEPEKTSEMLCEWIEKFIETKDNERTKSIYKATLSRIKHFTSEWETLSFDDIDVKWLKSFEKFLSQTSKSSNGRGVHLRNIRSVFNYAMSENIEIPYPFKKFKIKSEPTMKRSFTSEQLRKLFSFEASKYSQEGKDILMLTFFLCGINFYDLTHLTEANVINGRIDYVRAKTKKFYSIKLEPEAVKIIERRKGANYLIDIKDRYKEHYNALEEMNKKIKLFVKEFSESVCSIPNKERVSTYWARHSWATTAAELDTPKETIAAGLGHSIGNPITSIYIDFNLKKVDEANRRIIDYILYSKV